MSFGMLFWFIIFIVIMMAICGLMNSFRNKMEENGLNPYIITGDVSVEIGSRYGFGIYYELDKNTVHILVICIDLIICVDSLNRK